MEEVLLCYADASCLSDRYRRCFGRRRGAHHGSARTRRPRGRNHHGRGKCRGAAGHAQRSLYRGTLRRQRSRSIAARKSHCCARIRARPGFMAATGWEITTIRRPASLPESMHAVDAMIAAIEANPGTRHRYAGTAHQSRSRAGAQACNRRQGRPLRGHGRRAVL